MARLDRELVRRGLVASRAKAATAIAAGQVAVDKVVARKPAASVSAQSQITVAGLDHYVSRAAHKLRAALAGSGTDVSGRRVLDAGASTGGFTQVLLESGAAAVYAVDVGHGQLAPSLAADPRVTVWEGVNLRDLALEHVGGEPVDVVVADVSFISLKLILAPMLAALRPDGLALLLVKPQFEVGRAALNSQGVVKDAALRDAAVAEVVAAAAGLGWVCDWRDVSQLPGESGNVEWFVHLVRG
ncbi:MAG: TlyA family RNA methyltransferase [Propionibacteriaceae bacterium]|jgi:23S rRNA (cytidine1920-2'-O)/16S rRNA (cytidine1409-2'-O)-methyltransferase|nr:TlyA family RNA methyltransferase [Propionibacteriaceae bacterium]